jgi:hypothetical protein
MAEDCQDLRMNLKSVFTQRIYKSERLKDTVHRKCLEWLNTISERIYNDGMVKTILNRFITQEKDDITSFVKRSLELLPLHPDEWLNNILTRINLSLSQNNYDILYTDTLIYDLFFIMYMKGGMATRYICLYLNTLTDSIIYSKENLLENLGDISDYDFNMTINPLLPKNHFTILKDRLSQIVDQTFLEISTKDTFFTDRQIIAELETIASDIIKKHPTLSLSVCRLERQENTGKATRVDLEPFSLSRLMVSIKTSCRHGICKGDSSVLKVKTALLAELIDVSYPSYDSFSERMHAWKYGNNAILISFCDLESGKCKLPLTPSKTTIRFNSLDDILDDIQYTITQSIARGDFSKVEKRKKRLKFLGNLVCNYELARNRVYGGEIKTEVIKKCQEAVESIVCKNQYINKDVGFYISNLAVGLEMDDLIIYRIVRSYIFELTKRLVFQKTAILIDGSIKLMDIIEYTIGRYDEYLQTTPNATLLSLRDRICRLMIECISLDMSFTDNYMKNFIAQLFIKTLLEFILGDYAGVESFDKKVILEKENVYNVFIKPFIGSSVNYILDSLLTTCEKTCGQTQIRVEDSVACHYNIYKTLDGLKSEKITVSVFTKELREEFVTVFWGLINPYISQYNQAMPGMAFNPEIEQISPTEYLLKINVEYDNIFFQRDIFYMRGITFQNTSFKIKHTLLELRMVDGNIPQSDITLVKSSPSGKVGMGVTSKQKLLNESNISIDQSVHWYTKSIYTRSLLALNDVITDPEIRTIYNAEFPPITKDNDPDWLKQLVAFNQTRYVQPHWLGRQPTNDQILESIKDTQKLFLPYFPLELVRSIQWYTVDENYGDLNRNLRQKLPLTADQQVVVRNIDYLFSIVRPIDYPVTLYRGMRAKAEQVNPEALHGILKDDAFISTSTSFASAMAFASVEDNCCMLVISVPAHAKVLAVSVLSPYEREHEMLLERGSSFVIRRTEDVIIENNIGMRLLYVDYLHE